MQLPHDPRLWPEADQWKLSLAVMGFYAWAVLAVIGDFITTAKGLARGFVEANPIDRWLFKKIGQSLTCFIEGTAMTITAAAIGYKSLGASMLFLGIVAGFETFQTIKNYRKLK